MARNKANCSGEKNERMRINLARDYDCIRKALTMGLISSEVWVKGDGHKGYADSLKVECRPAYPDGSRLIEKSSRLVTGITDEWQRAVIPWNLMRGIIDWDNLKEFVISFQSRRANVKEGLIVLMTLP